MRKREVELQPICVNDVAREVVAIVREEALNRCLDLLKDTQFLRIVTVGDRDQFENYKNWLELRAIERPVIG